MPHPLMFAFKQSVKVFLREILASYGSMEVFSLESSPLYGMLINASVYYKKSAIKTLER